MRCVCFGSSDLGLLVLRRMKFVGRVGPAGSGVAGLAFHGGNLLKLLWNMPLVGTEV